MEKGQLVFNLANIENFNPDDFFISDSNKEVSSLLKETESVALKEEISQQKYCQRLKLNFFSFAT